MERNGNLPTGVSILISKAGWKICGKSRANLMLMKIARDFNCVPLELTKDDLDYLEEDITNNHLPRTNGFFFGDNSDAFYSSKDLEFVQNARDALDNGMKVVYDSWW